MNIFNLGFPSELINEKAKLENDGLLIARVIREHKERYTASTGNAEYEAEVIGNLRFSAQGRADFPAVGDWVAIMPFDEQQALIQHTLPRKTILERQAVGKHGEKQIIASNIDTAFIVQAVKQDFNLNRAERYITLCNQAKVEPILVLNKTDLIGPEELNQIKKETNKRLPKLTILTANNFNTDGYNNILKFLQKGKTYCLMGSSGVGKSTICNAMLGEGHMQTNTISNATGKGKHVTSHRELIPIHNGAILIDTPGMREVGIADATEGLGESFSIIYRLQDQCKYKNCTHVNETGCAVLKALENGDLAEEVYLNFQKLEKEKQYFEDTVAEKRKKDKDFGKMIKGVKKDMGKLSDKHKKGNYD
jgi:ribosome biogenesis GTPase